LTTPRISQGRYATNPNCFTQKVLAIAKPLLAIKRYDSTTLLNEIEKVMPGLNRQRANVAMRNTAGKEIKYSQGIWSLALTDKWFSCLPIKT